MDGLKEREIAAETLYIHHVEAEFDERLKRIGRLGTWACGLMVLTKNDEDRYQDILYRLAIAGADDSVIISRVIDDLSAAGISAPRKCLCEILGQGEATP